MKTKMKFDRYPKYKDSGVEWLGEIPEGWDAKPIRAIFQERRKKNEGPITDFILSVTKDRGVIPYDEKGAIGNNKSEDIEHYKVVYPNDLVINKMNVVIGSLGLSKYHGALSQVYIVLKPKSSEFNINFLTYIFLNSVFFKSLIQYCKGIMELRESLDLNEFKKINLPIPKIEEQIAITNFLDNKGAKIDAIIKQKEDLIKLLKEQKQIIIQNAVTKGIESNRKMKDSGVEWIGEIPEEWRIEKLKTFTNFINRGSTPSYVEKSDVYVINQATFSKGFFDLSNIKYTKETIESFNKNRGRIKKYDLLIASTGGGVLGKVAYFTLEEGSFIADSHVTIIRTNKNASNKFYYYLFSINYKLINGVLAQGSTNQTELQREWLRNFLLPLPTKKEQKEIINYIETQSSKIDKSIKFQEKQIKKLKEYKETLIDSVVTGKVRV